MSHLPAGVLIGRAAAIKNLSDARARIDLQNSLARAVRVIHESATCAPVAQILIPANPFGQEN